MSKKKRTDECGPDVLDAIRNAYPDNVVTETVILDDGSYFDAIRDDVRAALNRIGEAHLTFERTPEGRPHWEDGADPEEDPPSWAEEPSSYDLLFFALRGEQFEFEGELDEEDFPEDEDKPVLVTFSTVGKIGCAVGISIVAPFAVIRFTEMEIAESGSQTMPDIWPRMFNLDGGEVDLERHYEELFLEEGISALRALREKITSVLREFGIRVLSEQELAAPLPKLILDLERAVSLDKKNATVCDVLFFQTI